MNKVDFKYRIALKGKYHKGVNDCPYCDFQPKYLHDHTIGFADSNIGIMAVIECPKCFENWFFHARTYEDFMHYEIFLGRIEHGFQKHYK